MTTGARCARLPTLLVALVASACAARAPLLPADAGVPFPGFAAAHAEASAACLGVRTFTAEIGLSGRVAGTALRGRLIGGFERPASLRLDGVPPFGQPLFILAARDAETVLWLPRDRRVLRGAPPAAVLDAIAGVALAPADLQAVLTGCVTDAPEPVAGRLHANGWVAITLADGAIVYLERVGTWRPRAARRVGWVVEYPPFVGTFPGQVVLRSTEGAVEVTAEISQFEANTPIDPAAFTVVVPEAALPITLDELRASGPLRAADGGGAR